MCPGCRWRYAIGGRRKFFDSIIKVALLVALAVMDRYMWGVGAVGVPRPSPALPWGCLPKQPGGQSDAKALHTCQQSNDAGLHCLHIGLASTSNSLFFIFINFRTSSSSFLFLYYDERAREEGDGDIWSNQRLLLRSIPTCFSFSVLLI